jgi:hypothetical protein
MNKRHLMMAAFLVTIGIITYGDISQCHDMPWPPRYVATALAFGVLDLFSIVQEDLAGVIAVGIVIAAIVNKGFTVDSCNHAESTVQPASYQTLQGGVAPTSLA